MNDDPKFIGVNVTGYPEPAIAAFKSLVDLVVGLEKKIKDLEYSLDQLWNHVLDIDP